MSAIFDRVFEILIGHEGGYSDDPKDPGNWTGGAVNVGELKGTKYGIAANTFPNLDIRNLSLDQAKNIYSQKYWAPVRGDDLPFPIALVVFDGAVNSGVSASSRWLQTAVGAAPDGIIGPATLAAVRATVQCYGVQELVTEFLAQRAIYLSDLTTWRSYRLGWMRRLFRLSYQSGGD